MRASATPCGAIRCISSSHRSGPLDAPSVQLRPAFSRAPQRTVASTSHDPWTAWIHLLTPRPRVSFRLTALLALLKRRRRSRRLTGFDQAWSRPWRCTYPASRRSAQVHEAVWLHTVPAKISPKAAMPSPSSPSIWLSSCAEKRSTCSHLCVGEPGKARRKASLLKSSGADAISRWGIRTPM